MLAALGVADGAGVQTARGDNWAAATIPPAAREASCGADVYSDNGDILLWAGDVLLPSSEAVRANDESPTRTIGRALLDRLRTGGAEALADVDGAFCGAWFDGRNRRWIVFNDRVGMVPVFWSTGHDALTVGPRAWATWQATGQPLEIDPLAVALMLRTHNMVGERTLVKGVSWLGPGSTLEWDGRRTVTRPYWDFRYDRTLNSVDDAADAYVSALRQTVQQSIRCASPLLLGISGGLDSRLILAMCAELGRVPACFTVGFPFAEDVRFGRKLARTAGTTHDWHPLPERDLSAPFTDAIFELDGLHNIAHFPPAVAARAYLARHSGGVLLEGYFHGMLGGAEIAADDDVNAPCRPHETRWAASLLHQGGSFALLDTLLKPALARESFDCWREGLDCTHAAVPSEDPLRRAEHTIIRGRLGRIESIGTAFLGRDVLLRTPGAHRAMIEWFQTVPPRFRRSRSLYVDVLRRRFPRFARVQRSNSSALPIDASRWRREYHWQCEKLYRLWAERRYPILRRWGSGGTAIRAATFETWRREGGLDVLRSPEARVLEWVNPSAVTELWNRAERDPLQGVTLLGLLTIETLIRRLESLPTAQHTVPTSLDLAAHRSTELVGAAP